MRDDLQRPRLTGVIITNIGTPDSTAVGDVRRYLREFLSDPRVVDINPVGRWLLLNLIILPFRPAKSAHAYQSIWMQDSPHGGSPLLHWTREFEKRLAADLGAGYVVETGMRYGNPSLASALDKLHKAGCERIAVLPLFPHYSPSSGGSALEGAYTLAAQMWNVPNLAAVPPFFDDAGFIEAFAAKGQPVIAEIEADYVLFSFHGVPERQIEKSDESPAGQRHCLASADCCATITMANRNCYRAQCYATARLIAGKLGLGPEGGRWSVSFQSRLGRTPWIRPYTDEVLPELAKKGVKRVAVYCPAFVADCLETLEEIGIRAKEDFTAAGGDDLRLIPSLNDDAAWVSVAARLVRQAVGVSGRFGGATG
jgi:protoporphyrin/coproporphyrin ferrochelatase